jgi:hypothetical protein
MSWTALFLLILLIWVAHEAWCAFAQYEHEHLGDAFHWNKLALVVCCLPMVHRWFRGDRVWTRGQALAVLAAGVALWLLPVLVVQCTTPPGGN